MEDIQKLMEHIQKPRKHLMGWNLGTWDAPAPAIPSQSLRVSSGTGIWGWGDFWVGNKQPTTLGSKSWKTGGSFIPRFGGTTLLRINIFEGPPLQGPTSLRDHLGKDQLP